MAKDDNSKPNSKLGQKNSSNNQSQPKVDCITRFKDPKPCNKSIKAKFFESGRNKVSEQIQSCKTGDFKANLIALMNRIISLGDLNSMLEEVKS
jgi:hypothetical protein